MKPLGFPGLGLSAAAEKKALNLAFVATPLLTLLLPLATKVCVCECARACACPLPPPLSL